MMQSLVRAAALAVLVLVVACGQEPIGAGDADAFDVDAAAPAEVQGALFGDSFTGASSLQQVGLGDGSDGALTVGALTTLNTYADVASTIAPGARTVVLGAARSGATRAFASGDLILLHRFAGAGAGLAPIAGNAAASGNASVVAGSVGSYEFARVAAVSGSTLTLTEPLTSAVSLPATDVQVVLVPEFTTLTVGISGIVTGAPFDGRKGGVVVVLARDLVNNGVIRADALGYRGGTADGPANQVNCPALDGQSLTGTGGGARKGEGIAEDAFTTVANGPVTAYGRGNRSNGGGGGNCDEAGGGGGGNGGRGGRGGSSVGGTLVGGQGGAAIAGASTAGQLLFGGGGGAGEDTGGATGGNGGGVVYLRTGSLTGSGTVTAVGSIGVAGADGDGGGGAGGTVLIQSRTGVACGVVRANGGNGGGTNTSGSGGGGGGGVIRVEGASVATCNGAQLEVRGGTAGLDQVATDGASGSAVAALGSFNVCGNGAIESGDACDDGNVLGGDGCSPRCRVETCNAPARATNGDLHQACAAGNGDSWASAAAMCDSRTGWTLAVVDSAAELTTVRAVAAARNVTSFYVNGVDQTTEQTFRRSRQTDNTLVTFLQFAAGENAVATRDAQDCLASQAAGYADVDCDAVNNAFGYVCEADCGDGIKALEEGCDDGNVNNADACSNTCRRNNGQLCNADGQCETGVCDANSSFCEAANTCGNGRVEGFEKCDDGNAVSGDGCSSACTRELGAACGASGDCASAFCDGNVCACDAANDCSIGKVCDVSEAPNACENANTCGNGVLDASEVCEDGNTRNGDGCSSLCKRENGVGCALGTDCASGTCDGSVCACDAAADCAAGEFCDLATTPNSCRLSNQCGNGALENNEGCDDNNTVNGDGCSSVCQVELNGVCAASTACASGLCETGRCRCNDNVDCGVNLVCDLSEAPNACEAQNACGNGSVEGAEACDDGNTVNGDACTSACKLPLNGVCTVGTACDSGSCEGGRCTCADDRNCAVQQVCDVIAAPNACEAVNTCGNGRVEGVEACDDGAAVGGDGCSAGCLLELAGSCGDDADCATNVCEAGVCACAAAGDCAGGQVCDANETPNACEGAGVCGNGSVEGAEACDDGNEAAGDGCSDACLVEIGGACDVAGDCTSGTCSNAVCACDADADCGAGQVCDPTASACEPQNACGNGVVEADESCDEGAAVASAACAADCRFPDGVACADDADCSSGVCNAATDVCAPADGCGNGSIDDGEACDDGNVADDDGCSEACAEEAGFDCNGAPSLCASECGDGTRASDEECDDDNTVDGDGCSAICAVEAVVGEGEGEGEGEGDAGEGEGEAGGEGEGEGEAPVGEGEGEGGGEPGEGEGEGQTPPESCGGCGQSAAMGAPAALLALLRRRRRAAELR